MKRAATAGLVLVLCLASAAQDSDITFKVDVKLVNVFVTVTDEHGAPIAGLTKDNFDLMEDDKAQKIALFDKESALPLNIVMAVDTSLSTRKDLPLELASARRFAHAILRPMDVMSLYQFSETVSELTPFTPDLRAIDRGIDRVRGGAATALYDALFLGSQALEPRQGRKVMVVITDGGDTMSKVNYQEAVRAAETAEAILYSIIVVPIEASAGRDIGGEHALITLAEQTGGKSFYASEGGLAKAFERVSEDLRTQYLLGYYPKNQEVGRSFHRLLVTVPRAASDAFNIRYRSGYYSDSPAK